MALSLEIVDKSIVWLWHCHWQTSGMALSLEIVDKSIVWLWNCHGQTSGMALSPEIVDKSMVWLWNLIKKVAKIMVWLLPLHCQYSYTAVLKTNTVDKVTLWP